MEKFSKKLLRIDHFILRVLRFYCLSVLIFFLGLLPGIIGFYFIEGHSLTESMLNALSMLSGQSINPAPVTSVGRFFIAIYGLFLQSVFIITIGLLVTPFIHRILHKWHLEDTE
ncbi:hypothetical protein [Moellerella wisconsensis]|uniref:Uncharacterized protein n=2 Tax=Moellerella wisconsensis TaxID=158849 RepID=A0A9Q8Q4Z9_9GAMM|nr:hypothetical protein [Moellerella wisconsensis]KLN97354.1 membrane protein [Moellerella wisconsensis]UNH25423.1 hypothetical protein MNY68_06855 [Moellerella wisconsensis]UNH28608.1 hypothetical protein MNY64_07455 [Moellerella wisconsensis]UNH32062.1 hypothetical protein MNY72_07215 [Moellerella wisconsensis]UNH40217.1 hypothetical protein MNY70_07255 [Moellerella wisconsensis]